LGFESNSSRFKIALLTSRLADIDSKPGEALARPGLPRNKKPGPANVGLTRKNSSARPEPVGVSDRQKFSADFALMVLSQPANSTSREFPEVSPPSLVKLALYFAIALAVALIAFFLDFFLR